MKKRGFMYMKELAADVLIFTGIFVFFIAITAVVIKFIN